MGQSESYKPNLTGPFQASLPTILSTSRRLSGNGSPEGTVPAVVGQLFHNLLNDDLYLKLAGVQKIGWVLIGKVAPEPTPPTPPTPVTNIFNGPLDQAVFVPAVGSRAAQIVGVRGGYLLGFDPVTGATNGDSSRYTVPAFGDASIGYDSGGDKIYILHWFEPDGGVATKGIYRIDPSTLEVEILIDLLALGFFPDTDSWLGRMIVRGGLLYGVVNISTNGIFRYSIAGATADFTYAIAGNWQECEVNGVELWVTDSQFGSAFIYDAATMNFITTIFSPGVETWGLCVNPGNGRGYFTTRSPAIKRVESDHTVLSDLTLPNVNATPFCIRYNAADNKIYCPDETTNTVYVIDGTTEAIIAKTGFDSPFDFVPGTPPHVFATQHGMVPLKEIS